MKWIIDWQEVQKLKTVTGNNLDLYSVQLVFVPSTLLSILFSDTISFFVSIKDISNKYHHFSLVLKIKWQSWFITQFMPEAIFSALKAMSEATLYLSTRHWVAENIYGFNPISRQIKIRTHKLCSNCTHTKGFTTNARQLFRIWAQIVINVPLLRKLFLDFL